jgi:PASTA domain
MYIRTVAIGLGALALAGTIAITGCSANTGSHNTAVQSHSAAATAPSTSTGTGAGTPAATVAPVTGITTAPVTQESCSPADSQGSTTAMGESILGGGGYSPVNSLQGDNTIYGGALGQDSTGAEAVMFPFIQDGILPASFAASLNNQAVQDDLPVKAAVSPCDSTSAVIVTGSKANVVALLFEETIDTKSLSAPPVVVPAPTPSTAEVPSVTGLPAATATAELETDGFKVTQVTEAGADTTTAPGSVWQESPVGYSSAPYASTVTIYVQPGTTP